MAFVCVCLYKIPMVIAIVYNYFVDSVYVEPNRDTNSTIFFSYSSLNAAQYELRLAASDNLKENYTTVVIHVKDVNE